MAKADHTHRCAAINKTIDKQPPATQNNCSRGIEVWRQGHHSMPPPSLKQGRFHNQICNSCAGLTHSKCRRRRKSAADPWPADATQSLHKARRYSAVAAPAVLDSTDKWNRWTCGVWTCSAHCTPSGLDRPRCAGGVPPAAIMHCPASHSSELHNVQEAGHSTNTCTAHLPVPQKQHTSNDFGLEPAALPRMG